MQYNESDYLSLVYLRREPRTGEATRVAFAVPPDKADVLKLVFSRHLRRSLLILPFQNTSVPSSA